MSNQCLTDQHFLEWNCLFHYGISNCKYKIIMSTPCENFNFQRRKIHVFLTQHKSLTKKTNDVTHKHLPQASSKDLKDFWIYWDMAVTFRTLRLEEFSYLTSLCEEVWVPKTLERCLRWNFSWGSTYMCTITPEM